MSDNPPSHDPSGQSSGETVRPWAAPDAAAEAPPGNPGWTAPPPPPPASGWGSPTPGWGGTTRPVIGPPPPPPSTGWPGAVPPPPGQPPYWAPSRQAPIRRARVAMGLGAVLLLAVVGLVAYARTTADDKYPDEWDPRVTDLVDFVEKERGLEFQHPVHVDFLSAEEYSDAVTGEDFAGVEEEDGTGEQQAAFLRALGLAEGEIDMGQASDDMADASTLAFYNMLTKRVTVRGEDLTVDVEVTLVHELTHALQDQQFDLSGLQEEISADLDLDNPDLEVFDGFQALVEGDAVRIENAYIAGLSSDDLDDYIANYNDQVAEAEDELGSVPQVMFASMLVPYELGGPLVDLIAADGGNDAVDDAFDQLPSTGEHLLDPRSYFDADDPSSLSFPDLPAGVDDATDEGTLSAVDVYLLLAERIDPLVALEAADGWGNARYVSYEDDDRTCVRFAVAGDSTSDDDELARALSDWADETPDGEVLDEDSATTVQTCDPGEDGPSINDRAMDALTLPVARSQIMLQVVEVDGIDVPEAWDIADCTVNQLGFEKVVDITYAASEAEAEELAGDIDAANEACSDA